MEMLLRQFLSTSVPEYQRSSLHFQSDQDQYQQASTGFHARNPALLLQAWKQNILEYLNQSTSVPSSKLPGSSTRDLLQPKSEGWFTKAALLLNTQSSVLTPKPQKLDFKQGFTKLRKCISSRQRVPVPVQGEAESGADSHVRQGALHKLAEGPTPQFPSTRDVVVRFVKRLPRMITL